MLDTVKQEKRNSSNRKDKVVACYKDNALSIYKREKNTLMRTAKSNSQPTYCITMRKNMLNSLYLISPSEILHMVNKTKFPSKYQHKYSST